MSNLHHVGTRVLRLFGYESHRHQDGIQITKRSHSFDHTFDRLRALRQANFSPASICDVGASDGSWSRKCLEVFPNARYFCVEPLEENHSSLAQLSSQVPNVAYWKGCLGSRAGFATLNVDGAGTSILRGHWGNSYGEQREVPLETLDNLIGMGASPQPDLIKLDVQGYELEVLLGAQKALGSVEAIVAEVCFFSFQSGMPIFHEVVGKLAEYGFVVADVLSLQLRPLDGAAGFSDLLFLKKTHPLHNNIQWDHNTVY